MKLSPRDLPGLLRNPDPKIPAILVYGEDPVRVAMVRKDLAQAIVGPEGDAEMRVVRLGAADLRKSPADLVDSVKATGFFEGRRLIVVEGAGDGLAPTISAAVEDWKPGDATMLFTAGQLTARGALRKFFEKHRAAQAIALYESRLSDAEVDRLTGEAGLSDWDREGRAAIYGLARTLDPGDLRQTIEKLGLYMASESAAVTAGDVAAVAPVSLEAEMDVLIATVAAGRREDIPSVLRRLYAQGLAPVTVCIGIARHFRRLHSIASDPDGPAQGIGRLRPPVWGPARDVMIRQAGTWGVARIESALKTITDADLKLRSANQSAPAQALVERMLLRLAIMGQRRS